MLLTVNVGTIRSDISNNDKKYNKNYENIYNYNKNNNKLKAKH